VNNDPYIVMVPSVPTPLAAMASSEYETTYLGLLIVAAFWAFFSGAVVAVSQRVASQSAALGGLVSFVTA
jgi:hypothetical protein